MLAAGAPKQAAFMADESMLALPGLQPIKYDLPFFREYLKRVTGLVKELNKQGKLSYRLCCGEILSMAYVHCICLD